MRRRIVLYLHIICVICVLVKANGFSTGTQMTNCLIDIKTFVSFENCTKECLHRRRCESVTYLPAMTLCKLNYCDSNCSEEAISHSPGLIQIDRKYIKQTPDCNAFSCEINQFCTQNEHGRDYCHVSDCGYPPNVTNAQYFQNGIAVYSKVIYACKKGYNLNGKNYLGCDDMGKWQQPRFICEPIDCGAPEVQFAIPNTASTTYGSTVNISCMEKYVPSVSPVISCGIDGVWSNDVQCIWGGCNASLLNMNPECLQNTNINGSYLHEYAYYRPTSLTNNSVGPYVFRMCTVNQTWEDLDFVTCSTGKDCEDLYRTHKSNGVYTIQRSNMTSLVYCDFTYKSKQWTVIQRRVNGKIDFKKNWEDYKKGFGDINGDYWIGNEMLYFLTAKQPVRVIFVMTDIHNTVKFSEYSSFQIGPENSNYTLNISGYRQHNNSAGDSMKKHNGKQFSTVDRDNDEENNNCADVYHGGWWYAKCHDANPNGRWNVRSAEGIAWWTFHKEYNTTMLKMKIMIEYN